MCYKFIMGSMFLSNLQSLKQKIVLIGINSMQGWTTTTRNGATRKRSTKRLKYTWNSVGKNEQIKGVC